MKLSFGFLKAMGCFFVFVLILIYSSYIFLLPKYVTGQKVETLINAYLQKNTKLQCDIQNLKIYPNYKLNLNLKAQKITLLYSDNKTLSTQSSDHKIPRGKISDTGTPDSAPENNASKDNKFIVLYEPSIEINLKTLIFKYIDLDKLKADKITVNCTFKKNKKYDCFEFFDLNKLNLKSESQDRKNEFQLRNIKILTDEFEFNLYDENTNIKYLTRAKHNTLYLRDFKKPLELVTSGFIRGAGHKISDFNLKLEMLLEQDFFDKFIAAVKNLNYNPLEDARKFKFYTNADIDLKIKKADITGVVKLNDFNFVLDNIQIPKNNAVFIFRGNKIQTDCDFKLTENQFVKLKMQLNHAKNKFVELNLKTSTIKLEDTVRILHALSKIFNQKFDFTSIVLKGTAKADLYLKSDFKKVTSKGTFNIDNASLCDKTTGLALNNIKSDISLENNKINIKESSALFGNSKFHLTGLIDENARLNLKVFSDTIDIAQIITLAQSLPFVSKMLPKSDDYVFKSGLININAAISGDIKNPSVKTVSNLKNLKIFIKSAGKLSTAGAHIISENIQIFASPKGGTIREIALVAKNNALYSGNFKIKNKEASLIILEDKIILQKTLCALENIKFLVDCEIKNYTKNPVTDLNLEADLPPQNDFLIIKSAPKAKIKGNFLIDENKIQTSLFALNCAKEKAERGEKALVSAKGNILNYLEKPKLENFKIVFPEKIALSIPKLKLDFAAKGSLLLKGDIEKPDISGDVALYNVICKDFGLYLRDVLLNIKNSSCYLNIVQGKIFDFNFAAVSQFDLNLNKLRAKYVEVFFDVFDLEKAGRCFKDAPDIEIESLKGRANTLIFSDVASNNATFEGNLKNNILNIDKISADIYSGKMSGNIKFNIKTLKSNCDLVFKGVNVRRLSRNIKDISIAASGHLSALVNVSAAGLSYDDILKTIEGYVKFNIDNGELAQFAKLERYLQAGNILGQSILKLNINSVASALSKQNTGDFKTIEGTVKLKSPTAEIQYINTQGTNMATHTEGTVDIISKKANVKVLGRIPTSTVKILGDFGDYSVRKLVEKISDKMDKDKSPGNTQDKQTDSLSPAEKLMSTYITQDERSKIPPLAGVPDIQTREFIVFINGLVENPSSVRLFKWVIQE